MKKILTSVIAFGVAIGTLASSVNAEDYYHHDRDWGRHDNREYPARHEREREREFRHEREREIRHERWERGHALPYQYRREIVGNYGYYHLRRPPHGYHWVRVNGDYLLVAITTGIIADIILH